MTCSMRRSGHLHRKDVCCLTRKSATVIYDGNQVVAGVWARRVQERLEVKIVHRKRHCGAELRRKVRVVSKALQLYAEHLWPANEPQRAYRWKLGKKEPFAARDKVATLFAPVAVLPIKQLGVTEGLQTCLERNLTKSKRLADRIDDRAKARLSLGSIDGDWNREVEEGILLDRNRLAAKANNFGAEFPTKCVRNDASIGALGFRNLEGVHTIVQSACKPLGATNLAWTVVVISAGNWVLELFVQTIKDESEQVHGILQA